MAVEDVPDALGPFDYVVAHGLYSWVPAPARRRILEICGDRLAPHGVAYVSFNAYPGWHVREVVRRMMLRQARGASDPAEQVRRGLELVKRVADAQPSEHPMGAALRREWERLSKARVGQVYHDELAPINQPFWLDDFLADASRHGLKFLAEAQLESVVAPSGDAALAAAIDESAHDADDAAEREQYADFFRVRHFRQTLLCRANVDVRRPVDPARARSMWVTTQAKPESARPDVRTAAVERFRSPRGAVVSTNQPLAKAALVTLAEASPHTLTFDELGRDARSRCDAGAPAPAPAPPDELERILLSLLGGAMLELHVRPPRFVLEPSPRPRASALARAQV